MKSAKSITSTIIPVAIFLSGYHHNHVSAFSSPSVAAPASLSPRTPLTITHRVFSTSPKNPARDVTTSSALHASLAAASVAKATSGIVVVPSSLFSPMTARNVVLLSVAAVALVRLWSQRLLYPNSLPDKSFAEPLPPGTMGGCPLFGELGMFGNMNKFLWDKASRNGVPPAKVYKIFGFAQPMVIASGVSTIKKLLSHEFRKKDGISQPKNFGNAKYIELMFGRESMAYETKDVKKYHMLQNLVGQAMTPESVKNAIPALQNASENIVERMLSSDKVVMSDINHDFTVDVAWQQIIGLDLKKEQIQDFHDNVKTWITSITNYFMYMLPVPNFVLKRTKQYRAKQYLTKLIEDKIDDIEKNGPDGSTLSAMVTAAASDDDDAKKGKSIKLTRQQIIDNIFLLIIAGSETSSLTLTNAMLLLGTHPHVWDELVREQDRLVAAHGPRLTKDQLDKECPYLDAVIKETMRIVPLSGGGARTVDETFVFDGYQLPKDWMAMYSIYNTHRQDPKTWTEDGSHMDIEKGFRPERWLDAATKPVEFMPWGAGHRFCLGHHLATAEMRTFLAVMARKMKGFDWMGNVDSLKWKEGVIATPKDGVVISAHAR